MCYLFNPLNNFVISGYGRLTDVDTNNPLKERESQSFINECVIYELTCLTKTRRVNYLSPE